MLKVRVESTTPLPPPAETPAFHARGEDRPDRRGKRRETPAESADKTSGEKAEGAERKPRAAKPAPASKAEELAKPEKASKPEMAAKPARSAKTE
jgi:hypothetical protein